jgi:hypothetical protein
MNLAICTIQRDRGRWLQEWISFHYVVGFRKFYIFLHSCTDDSEKILDKLSRFFDISYFSVPDETERPQLAVYQYCYKNFGDQHDWMAFIDGDEFLFSPNSINISNQLAAYSMDKRIGAIGAYWICFGSSGHQDEPQGLIKDIYRWRSMLDFKENKHFKSIVKGKNALNFSVMQNSHYFNTSKITFDTKMRVLEHGIVEHDPCYDRLQINHYATQSREFYTKFKMKSGAADGNRQLVRGEDWWLKYDKNDVWDDSIAHLRAELKSTINSSSILGGFKDEV